MLKQMGLDDTIVAISTPPGVGGIGIVRLSGNKALRIGDKIFRSKNGKKPSKLPTFTVHYGYITEKETGLRKIDKSKVIDEVILTVMRAPKTYTKEDILEINCHGGIVPLRRILDLIVGYGARLARPGEFTQRAFLKGRIDLVQAEAVLNVVSAKTETALRPAMNQLQGKLSIYINELKEELINFIAPFEAGIDFPDETIDMSSRRKLSALLLSVAKRIKKLIDSADKGIMLQNGISIVLAGAANVGKSSIMNALVEYERVIVTHISGTTRDVVEELININGVPIRIADTAGIMDSSCVITKESIARSLVFFDKADLVLFVLDYSRKIKKIDVELAKKLKNKKVIIVINKSDKKRKVNTAVIRKILPKASQVIISALKKQGMYKLEKQIISLFFKGQIMQTDESIISNMRQKKSLEKCYGFIHSAVEIIAKKGFDECLVFEIKQALEALSEVLGENIDEDILDNIFSRFCIGK